MSTPPNILSLEFHTQFFPRLLWSRLRPKKKEEEGTRFTHTLDFMILLAFCLVLVAIGFPPALKHGSVVGWILGALGIGGALAIIIFSILSQLGETLSYDNFLIGIFFFFVFLGFTAGIFIGKYGDMEYLRSWWPLSGALGLFLGYVLGIFAGLWFQCLGWIAGLVDMFSGCAIIGIVIVDLVLLLKF